MQNREEEVREFSSSTLRVRCLERGPYRIARWFGHASEDATDVAEAAVRWLLESPAERLVLEFGGLAAASEAVVAVLARATVDALRCGSGVALVRCSGELYRRLRAAGARGPLRHFASLHAATDGLIEEAVSVLDVHFRSAPEFLSPLRRVVATVAQQAGLSGCSGLELQSAVAEAAANAILHGSPRGRRNHVRVSFCLDAAAVVVDVADQGPGFDPGGVPEPEPEAWPDRGLGLRLIRHAVDRLDFFPGEQGMLVRLTKFVGPPPA